MVRLTYKFGHVNRLIHGLKLKKKCINLGPSLFFNILNRVSKVINYFKLCHHNKYEIFNKQFS